MASVHDTNDPQEILKHPVHEILMRLREDSNKLKSLAAIDQAVLRGMVDRKKVLKTELDERLEEALNCVEAIVRNAPRRDTRSTRSYKPAETIALP
ncbi:MAG: hypothetical protein M3R38_09240 [Actinomycetota bacterium]|nr:hypothetical protein [Actinomycetota bacterium]